jgi:hypothetical protein
MSPIVNSSEVADVALMMTPLAQKVTAEVQRMTRIAQRVTKRRSSEGDGVTQRMSPSAQRMTA